MSGKQKKPTFAEIVAQTKKQPRVERNPEGYHQKNPAWRISRMELVDPFGWHSLNADLLHYVRGKIAEFEARTWGEILNSKHNHNVAVGRLCKEAQHRLDQIGQVDLEEILSLRLSGKERVWGILAEGICTLIWWDPDHQVCPSLKD